VNFIDLKITVGEWFEEGLLSLQSPEYVISSNGGEIVVWMLDVLLYQLRVNINCE
jgi:hypothetical protein